MVTSIPVLYRRDAMNTGNGEAREESFVPMIALA
jgi:hypothetical protein